MSAAVANEILRAAVLESAEDPAFFCRFFLKKWFPTPMPPFHLGLLALVTRKVGFLDKYRDAHEFLLEHFKYLADPNDPEGVALPVFQKSSDGHIMMVTGNNNAFIIPRGFSKTTLYNAANLHEIVTDPHTFSIYISESSTHAETQVGNIRLELETNDLLRQAYGNLVPTRSDSEKWTGDQLQATSGAVLVARGRGSQVRGINFRGRRPNRILLDDVEDEESVKTPEQRKKTVGWFYGSVMPAGNEMSGAGQSGEAEQEPLQITILGTLLGSETLLTTVAKDPTFNTVRFGSKLEDGSMLWPHKLSQQDYDRKRAQYTRVGQLSKFVLEFDSTVRMDDEALFKPLPSSFYIPIQPSELVQRAIALDPAISEQPGRDHSAIIVSGRREDGMLWFLDEWGGLGKTPRELIDAFFALHIKWNCTKAGIESVAYQRALIFLLREEMARRQRFFEVTPIIQGSKTSKDDRIVGLLQPRYSNGYIRHTKYLPGLEQNLADWPNGKKDYPDAAAMSLALLGESAMLVMPKDAVTLNEYESLETALPQVYDGPFLFEGSDPFAGRYG